MIDIPANQEISELSDCLHSFDFNETVSKFITLSDQNRNSYCLPLHVIQIPTIPNVVSLNSSTSNLYSLNDCEPENWSSEIDYDNIIDCGDSDKAKCIYDFDKFFGSLTQRIAKLHLNEESNNEIYKICRALIKQMQNLSTDLLTNDPNVDPRQIIDASTQFVCDKLDGYSTAYKRKKKVGSNDLFVPSEELSLGLKWEMLRDKKSKISMPKLTHCKFQYVSIVDTVRALFKRNDFREAYLKHNFDTNSSTRHTCTEGIYRDFCCGKVFKKNTLFRSRPTSIRIHLANDDFEVNNPLGSKAGTHKLSAFYFTIQNVPPELRAKLDNIFLVCLCYSDDLKTEYTDINNIWRLIKRDISVLETDGIEIEIEDEQVVKGTISHLSFDNLGANSALGFVCSFNSTYYCRFCEMNISECRLNCREDTLKRRNLESYNNQIECIKNSSKVDYKETRGVKMECVLNELQFFHILNNWSVDIMHDLNEGIIPFALRHFFQRITALKILTMDKLIQKLHYFDYGFLNQRNIPSDLNIDKHNLNQNAAQSKCLLQHIPFVFWEYQNNLGLNEFWVCIRSLLRIFTICYSTEITHSNIECLRGEIESHLIALKNLKLQPIPKHHFVVHYPTIIEEMGPIVNMCMFRFEAKHKTLKSFMNDNANHTNITRSIVRRHQEYSSLVKESYRIKIESGATHKLAEGFMESHSNILRDIIALGDCAFEVKFIKYCNQHYKESLFVFQRNYFYEIDKILKVEEKYFFLCSQYNVLNFNEFLNSFEIQKTNEVISNIIDFSNLDHKNVYEKKILSDSIYIICDSLFLGNKFDVYK